MDIAAVCLLRQLAWRCHLLLYRASHHPREDAAALSHQATKYGTRPQACTTLGAMDGTSLLAPYPWRSNTRHIRHHAFPSPPYQYHDANWTYPTLCCSIILSNGHKQANRIISLKFRPSSRQAWYHEIDTSTIKAEIIKQQNRRQALLKKITSSLKFSLQEFKQPKPFIIPHTLQTQHFVKPMIIFYHFDDKNFS